jgi:hypothetical protein
MLDNREKTPWRDYGHQVRVSHVNITTRAVVPAWTAGTQVDMDMSGRILRIWMPAIHAGMTEAGDWPNRVNVGIGVEGCSFIFILCGRA